MLYSFKVHTDQHAMTATPIPGYTVDKVRNALHSTGDVSRLFFVRGSVVKIYHFTENLCVRYIGASCGVFTAVLMWDVMSCQSVHLRLFLQNVRQHASNSAASQLRRPDSSNLMLHSGNYGS